MYQPNVPPGYLQPSAYFPPPGHHFETKTEKGLKFINWGLWLFALVMVFSLIVIMIMISNTYDNGFGVFFLALGFSAVMSIVMLISLLLWLLGFIYMFSGKEEYGPIHSHKVTLTLVFILLFIAVSIAQAIYSVTAPVYTGFGSDWEDIEHYSTSFFIVNMILSFISTLFSSLTWVFLIIELVSKEIKRLLWLAFGVSLAISIIYSILSMAIGIFGVFGGGLGIVVIIFVIYCYWRTYNRVKNREITPIIPPLMPPYGFPPGYPPQYPPQYLKGPPQYPQQ